MLKEAIEKNINSHYDIASEKIGINELILKEFVKGTAKLSIQNVEKILEFLNIKIDETKSQKVETALIIREESKDRFKYYAAYWLKKKQFETKTSTFCNYANALKNHIIPILGDIKLKELNREILQFFIYKVQGEYNLSEKTTKDYVAIIKQIMIDGQEEGVIPDFAINKRKLKYKKQELIGTTKSTYTEEEYRKIIEAILKKINYTKLGILIGLYTGMRIGEICALKFEDINFNNREINVTKTLQRIYDPTNKEKPTKIQITSTKTSNSTRIIPITNEIVEILKKMNTGSENYILTGTNKYSEPRTFRRKYTEFMNKIGIQPLKFHSLRHTFASMNIENGADIKTISQILGHSDIDTTLKVYTHTSEKQKMRAIEKFEALLKEKGTPYDSKYRGSVCCISRRTGKLDFIGTIQEVAEYLDNTKQYVCDCINLIKEDASYNIVPKIEGITHKNNVYMGG